MKKYIIGINSNQNFSEEEIMCMTWIKEWISKRKSINKKYGSYRLKHVVEKYFNHYIPEEAFINGAKALGFKESIGYFNMSFTRAVKEKDKSKI